MVTNSSLSWRQFKALQVGLLFTYTWGSGFCDVGCMSPSERGYTAVLKGIDSGIGGGNPLGVQWLRTLFPLLRVQVQPLVMRWACTQGPFAATLQSLHLDTPLLELQNAKKRCGTKHNYMHAAVGIHFGPKETNTKKKKKENPPSYHFWRAGSKKQECHVKRLCPGHAPLHSGHH